MGECIILRLINQDAKRKIYFEDFTPNLSDYLLTAALYEDNLVDVFNLCQHDNPAHHGEPWYKNPRVRLLTEAPPPPGTEERIAFARSNRIGFYKPFCWRHCCL